MSYWDWDRLRVLDAVATAGSVTGAAASLRMTSPAVSQQLRRLEAEVGVTVVERSGRGIRLTPDGHVIADTAARIAELINQADNAVHDDRTIGGTVRLGAVASAIRTVACRRLPSLVEAHEALRVDIDDGETVDHLRGLRDGRLDLVIAESWSTNPVRIDPRLRTHVLDREDVVVAVNCAHQAATDPSPIHMGVLSDSDWATCAEGSDGHQAVMRLAHDEGVDIRVRYHVADHATQLALVDAGLAVACVPSSATANAAQNTAFRACAAKLSRELILVERAATSSRAVNHVAAALRDHEGRDDS